MPRALAALLAITYLLTATENQSESAKAKKGGARGLGDGGCEFGGNRCISDIERWSYDSRRGNSLISRANSAIFVTTTIIVNQGARPTSQRRLCYGDSQSCSCFSWDDSSPDHQRIASGSGQRCRSARYATANSTMAIRSSTERPDVYTKSVTICKGRHEITRRGGIIQVINGTLIDASITTDLDGRGHGNTTVSNRANYTGRISATMTDSQSYDQLIGKLRQFR